MKTITALLLLALLSSFSLESTCEREKLCGKWLLVDSYEEGSVTVDSLLKMEIVSHTRVKITYQSNGITQNNQGDYITNELFTLYTSTCRIHHLSLTSTAMRNVYIQYLDDHYLITSERGLLYFYEREKE